MVFIFSSYVFISMAIAKEFILWKLIASFISVLINGTFLIKATKILIMVNAGLRPSFYYNISL